MATTKQNKDKVNKDKKAQPPPGYKGRAAKYFATQKLKKIIENEKKLIEEDIELKIIDEEQKKEDEETVYKPEKNLKYVGIYNYNICNLICV